MMLHHLLCVQVSHADSVEINIRLLPQYSAPRANVDVESIGHSLLAVMTQELGGLAITIATRLQQILNFSLLSEYLEDFESSRTAKGPPSCTMSKHFFFSFCVFPVT